MKLKAEDQRLLEDYYISKLRAKKEQKARRKHHQSILKPSRSQASRFTLKPKERLLPRNWQTSSPDAPLLPAGGPEVLLRGQSTLSLWKRSKDANDLAQPRP